MQDVGVHEIQLNGKQLVFLFMAATVVAVVIFLCGVMVGRGVPLQRATVPSETPDQIALDPTVAVQPLAAPTVTADTETTPLPDTETLTYAARLEDPNPPAETLKPPSEAAVPPAAPVTRSRPPPSSVAAGSAAATSQTNVVDVSLREPAGRGFVVQVAAVRQRAEAETIARRLTTKGYPAFVTTAGANFRVRVGKYPERGAAEAIAGRLERDEHFKPWITR